MENANIFRIKSDNPKQDVYYEVPTDEEPIGLGGAGSVRRGYQVNPKTGIRREVAIKFLYDDLPEAAIKRSEREASIRITHENLVEMIDFVRVAEEKKDIYSGVTVHYHVVSELLHGVVLLDLINGEADKKLIADNPKLKELCDLMRSNRNVFAANVVRALLSGIMALHDNGYIHRDIDPSNIMVTLDGKIKLIDLGIAKKIKDMSVTSQLTNNGQFIGKAAYASPELVDGDTASQNETTDIYAIGIVLYQMVTGMLPFNGPMYDVLQLQKHKEMPLERIEDKKLRIIIKKATRKKQSLRYQSAAMFRADLDRYINNEPLYAPFSIQFSDVIPWAAVIVSGLLTGAAAGYLL